MKTLRLLPLFLLLSIAAFSQVGLGIYPLATASGTDTYTATVTPTFSAYTSGQRFHILFTNANTGASTININSKGAKSIVKNGSTAISASDIAAGQAMFLVYDGTNMQIVGGVGGGGTYTAGTGLTLVGAQFRLGGTLTSTALITVNQTGREFRLGGDDGLGGTTIFKQTKSGLTFTDSRASTTGIEYAGDYSAGFTDGSLIDKRFGNANYLKVTGGTLNLTETLTINTSTVSAALINPSGTFIAVNSIGVVMGANDSNTLIRLDNDGSIKIEGLPTVSPCATEGTWTLWNDGGFLKICP